MSLSSNKKSLTRAHVATQALESAASVVAVVVAVLELLPLAFGTAVREQLLSNPRTEMNPRESSGGVNAQEVSS